jgi:methionyl-tRNA formyltransferase
MKIVFMGTMDFAVPILEGLRRNYDVVLVVTQPDRPVGRKQTLQASPVKLAALRHGIPVFQPERIRKEFEPVLAADPDLIVVAAYGQMIPDIVLDRPRFSAINVHASLLPKYRGGAPMHRAIANGDATTGVSVMFMATKMDAGPVLSQREIPILDSDTVGTIEAKLGVLGRDLLLETLPAVFAGTIVAVPQDERFVTFAPTIKPAEERIDFAGTMKRIYDHVRAFQPWPTAYAELDDVKIIFHAVRIVPDPTHEHAERKNGEIVRVAKNAFFIKVADGLVEPLVIQPAGKTAMDVKAYMNGAGRNVLVPGKIFNVLR